MLYTTLSAVLKIPYKPLSQSGQLPLPLQCLFLEMTVRICSVQLILYEILIIIITKSTPRVTHLLQMATSHGWFTIDGMQVKKSYPTSILKKGIFIQFLYFFYIFIFIFSVNDRRKTSSTANVVHLYAYT